jgi:hypothetical protein
MRQYVVDELRKKDLPRIREYLGDHARASGLADIWWVDVGEDLLSPEQFGHHNCQPYRFAIELGDDFLRFEFLIRSEKTMRCSCVDYATRQQRDFILAFADRLVEDLALKT